MYLTLNYMYNGCLNSDGLCSALISDYLFILLVRSLSRACDGIRDWIALAGKYEK